MFSLSPVHCMEVSLNVHVEVDWFMRRVFCIYG